MTSQVLGGASGQCAVEESRSWLTRNFEWTENFHHGPSSTASLGQGDCLSMDLALLGVVVNRPRQLRFPSCCGDLSSQAQWRRRIHLRYFAEARIVL